jgi:hypothetical protein
VSQSLYLGDTVAVQGFPWCKDAPKIVGLASLTAKILCKEHNSRLSDIDSAAGAAFDAIRQSTTLSKVRNRNSGTRWTIKRYLVDGPKLERWFLKTLINLCHGHGYRVGRDAAEDGDASTNLVEIAFGLQKFQGRAGLYSIVRVGQNIQSDDTVRFAPLIKNQQYIAGGLWSFHGFRYLLFLQHEGPPQPLSGVSFDGEDLGQSQLNFHNEQARENVGKYLSHVVQTKW